MHSSSQIKKQRTPINFMNIFHDYKEQGWGGGEGIQSLVGLHVIINLSTALLLRVKEGENVFSS